MHKGIRLVAQLRVEGTPEATVLPVIREMLTAGLWRHPDLKVSIKRLTLDAADPRAAQLKVRVEGEAEPAFNWALHTTRALAEMLVAGQWRHPAAKLTVQTVEEDRDWEEEAGAE